MTTTRHPNLLIVLCGLLSALLALGLVAVVNMFGFNIMGLYIMFVIPVGGILVGVVSGLGYAIGSKLCDVKIRWEFLIVILVLSVMTYVLSHFITYLFLALEFGVSPLQFTFIDYIRFICETTSYRSMRGGGEPVQLGFWGYPLHLLELVGFCAGAVIPSLLLGSKPYCDSCQLYMKKVDTMYMPSALQKPDWKAAKGKQQKEAVLLQAVQQATEDFSRWWEQAQNLTRAQVEGQLASMNKTAPANTLAHTQSDFYFCSSCSCWRVITNLVNVATNGELNTNVIHDSGNRESTEC